MTGMVADRGIAIAVVGLAARLPGAPTLADFRALIRSGRSALRRFDADELLAAGVDPARVRDSRFVPVKGALDEADCFDFAFFGVTPVLARAMDPQHRLFLECCWHALEDAGLAKEPPGFRIGVFAGASAASSYYHSYAVQDAQLAEALDPFQLYMVNQPAALSNQVSFSFNFTGPSVTLNTACSTGLATIVSACQSLLDAQCDAAVAGAVTVTLPLIDGYLAPPGSILSPSGQCRPFDAASDGTVPGEGVAAVVLKRLDDALRDGDRIHALIRGYGTTNDGARKVGFSAPCAEGQAGTIADAIAMAEIEPQDIGFLEAHGTGTAIGDAIEISALRDIFAGSASQSIALGATKAQIGHLDVAAGIAGFIKAVVAVEEGMIPPLCGARRPNPELRLGESPFRIPTSLEHWPSGVKPRRAGVSSFGMGGTNIHIVIEEAPPAPNNLADRGTIGWTILPLSASSPSALRQMKDNLASCLASKPDVSLADVGETLIRRRFFEYRSAIVAASARDACRQLRETGIIQAGGDGRIVFVFTGQGSQVPGSARILYKASPSFATALDLCRADLADVGCAIDSYLFEPGDDGLRDRLSDTEIAQPVLFAFAYAYAAMLAAWGIAPAALVGHSLGEFVALCIAGVLSRKDALSLVVMRGRAMQRLEDGAMLAVSAPAAAVERYLVQGAEIAAYNGPSQVVVAGPVAAIEALRENLAKDKIKARALASRRAFHTSSMRPALGEIEAEAKRVALKSPSIAVLSNLTGDFLASAPEPDYFARQASSPVRFGSALSRLIETGHRIFLEIGPGTALSGLIRANGSEASLLAVPVLPEPESGDAVEQALTAACRIWAAGFPLDWQKVDLRAKGRIVSLPPYPFARTKCWVGSSPTVRMASPLRVEETKFPASSDAASEIAAIWAACLGHERIETNADYHRLGGDSLSAIRIAELLSERFGVLIRPSDFLTAETPRRFAALIEDRRAGKQQETGIVIAPRDPDPHGDLLVLFHAIGGTVHLYGELLSALPEHCSIRLVQAPPFAGAGAQPETIEDMAKAYLAALDLDGKRRVHFGGASFGGSIALEAARQWLAQGNSAASIIMLDSPAPGDFNAPIFDEADVLAFMAQLIGGSVPAGHLRGMSQEARYQRIAELVAEHLPGGVDDEALALHIDVLRINALAMNLYRPEPLDDVPVTFLLAALRDMGQPEAPQKSWARFIRGPLWVETVPGGHLSMLTEPNVTKTAQAIERALARFAAQPVRCLS